MWTAFDYMYRDADNFKAFGTIILEGELSIDDRTLIQSRMESQEFFIAEQVGIPPLQRQLYRWSNGPTASDHCWHEFVGFREAKDLERFVGAIPAREFVARFQLVREWDEQLSQSGANLEHVRLADR